MAKKADIQALQDMNATLNTKNTKLKENVDSLTDTLTELRNEIKALKDSLAPKNFWQVWILKNISGEGIITILIIVISSIFLGTKIIKVDEILEIVRQFKK